jgi:hypothetical protein
MPKRSDVDDDGLKEEYDFSKMLILPRCRFDPKRRIGKNVIVLAPDVLKAFPDDDTVNEALRLVIQLFRISGKRKFKASPSKKAGGANRREITRPVIPEKVGIS